VLDLSLRACAFSRGLNWIQGPSTSSRRSLPLSTTQTSSRSPFRTRGCSGRVGSRWG